EDRHGDLWFGTWGGGLNRLRDRRIEVFTIRDGLAGDRVQALHQDTEGVLWSGTTEGLSRQDPQPSTFNPQRFFSFTTAHGLPDKQVNQILEDDAGHLWIGCDEGIYRVAKRELAEVATGRAARVECLLLDEQDGLLGGETYSGSQPSACKTPDGRLWFATPHGLAMLDPAHISRRDSQPKVFIERLRVGDAWLELLDEPGGAIKGARSSGRESAHSSLQRSQSRLTSAATLQGSKVQLSAGSGRSLAFEFTALEYFAPKKLRFRYRLEGFDRDWHDAGVRRTAFYTNLKPGDYRFQVIAANRNGVWNEPGASFALHLAPYLWQRWWFHPAWLFAAALAGFGLHRRRIRQIAACQELEKAAGLAEQRALLGADLHDAAGASLCQIVRQCEQAESASGDDRFAAVAASAREALEAFDETVWLLKPGNETLDRLALRIIRTGDKLLGSSGLRAQWQMPEDLPALPLKATAQRDLLLIVKESLHNVLKHARATEVCLQLELADGCLKIVIADNGSGFDPAAAPPDRHGLANLRRRAETWGGRLEIVSRVGAGTRVEVVVPIDLVAADVRRRLE
ncbi:MAG: triple tyrosine motif-containing protein, partial [Verrucomicrobiota bacterium]